MIGGMWLIAKSFLLQREMWPFGVKFSLDYVSEGRRLSTLQVQRYVVRSVQ